tara:strand:- start:3741 stop:4196 length:456 start_codon:yes stop_codon:yes gene_type:complete
MKKINLDTWIQLIGMLGVLAGLVFVGLELQQSQQIAIANAIQGRNQMQSNYLLAPLEGQLEAVQLRLPQDYQKLSPTQLLIRQQLILHRSVTITNAWQQYSLGLLTEEAWQVPAGRAKIMYNDCTERPWITASFTPSLMTYAEEVWKEKEC